MQIAASVADAALLRAYAARGDAAAFAELVRRYADMVYATARRVTGSAAAAEDVAQDCFLRLAQGSAAVRGSLGAWLHRTCLNRSLEILRSERARQRREAQVAEAAAKPGDATARDEAGELVSRVDEALAALPEELRVAVTEHFLCGRSQSEIAAASGLSQPTVSRRIDKGLQRLRQWLSENGVTAVASGVLPAVLADAAKTAAPMSLRPALVKIGLSGVRGAVAVPWVARPPALISVAAAALVVMAASIWWVLTPVQSKQVKLSEPPAAQGRASPPLAAVAGGPLHSEDQEKSELQGIIPQLPVADIDAAVRFYQQLGFRRVMRNGVSTNMVERDDERLTLASKTPPFLGPVSIRIEVKNVTALRKELEEQKVPLQKLPDSSGDAGTFAVTDPDGNRLVFEEELRN